MILSVQADYPIGTAYGSCYFCRAAKRDIIEEGPNGTVVRPERIVVTDREEDFEGRVCICESCARILAHEFALVDGWRVDAISADNANLRAELVALSAGLGRAKAENRRLADLDRPDVQKVYLDIDGNEHDSQRGAIERTAQILDLRPGFIEDAIRTALPVAAVLEAQPA